MCAEEVGGWKDHVYRVGGELREFSVEELDENQKTFKKEIEPWLSAVFQSEHLSLLLGSGFTTGVAFQAGAHSAGMVPDYGGFPHGDQIREAAENAAKKMGRGGANIEDQIRVANVLLDAMRIMSSDNRGELERALNKLINAFLHSISETERELLKVFTKEAETEAGENKLDAFVMLVSFLLSFSSRSASRERLNIFTTNYDRLIEFGADLAGLHVLDRFVGALEPIFRSSRLSIDMHYNPPGIRGEPRYLEGVVRLTKLHGSLDWKFKNGFVRKVGLPFGPSEGHPELTEEAADSVMIYPNSAKDRETSEYPYVELFRDYAAAVCRPNSAVVVYGYGFGDEHINRVLEDMLTIPSTHLVIISFDTADGRIESFCKRVGRESQISLLIGSHFGAMDILVENYLPKPAIDRISIRQTELLKNRTVPVNGEE